MSDRLQALSHALALVSWGYIKSSDDDIERYGRYLLRILADPYSGCSAERGVRACQIGIRHQVLAQALTPFELPPEWPHCGWYPEL